MEEEHLAPFPAVKKVVGEISGAIIAITLVMTSVFVPVAFMTGPVGVLYRQFSLTMAGAIVISGFVALTLTPVLCAILLKNTHGKPKRKTPINMFLDWFNRSFERVTGINKILPAGFIPSEDQGQVYAIIQTPPGTTLERTNEISRKLQHLAKEVEGVSSVTSLAGYEILTEGRGSNAGTCLINLKDWSDREHSVKEIVEELEEKTKDLPANIEYFEPPAVPGYGTSDGFSVRLLDKGSDVDYQEFDRVNADFVAALRKRKELEGLFSFYSAKYP
eukprot:gene49554-60668_t